MNNFSPYIIWAACDRSAHHVLQRHGLRGHGGGAPLRGGHGLVLPVLPSRQLLLSRLAPVHLRPESIGPQVSGNVAQTLASVAAAG